MRTAVCVGLLALLSATVATQSPASKPAFDAADVYVRGRSANANPSMSGGVVRNGRYDLRNATMVDLITTAYAVTPESVVGGPSWLEMKRFDIVAKVPNGTSQDTLHAMLQSLLAERFTLAVRKDTKPLPGYALTVGPNKHKLKEGTGGAGECVPKPFPPTAPGSPPLRIGAICRNVTMDVLANLLRPIGQAYLSDPAVNKTGLDGTWDFEFDFTPRGVLTFAGSDATTLFEALDKQLGLKLVQQEIPSDVLVVDRVNDQPTANPSGVASNIPAPPPAEFDVASIKLSAPGTTQTNGRIQPGGRINLDGATLQNLIQIAWNLNDPQLIVNAPSWFESTRYTINAIASNAVAGTNGNDLRIDFDDLSLMLQALLKERFQMKTHMENRPVEAYTLVADKPKLQPANPADRTRWKEGPAPAQADPRDRNPVLARLVTVQNMTMAQFAEVLQPIAPGYLRLPVEDATGLDGSYTFTFNFSPINALMAATARPANGGDAGVLDPNGAVSLFDALQKQLGLKLEQRKRSMPVLVIDHVEEKPLDN